MPTFDLRVVADDCKDWFNFSIGSEGIFLFITPIEFAILWPWVKL